MHLWVSFNLLSFCHKLIPTEEGASKLCLCKGAGVQFKATAHAAHSQPLAATTKIEVQQREDTETLQNSSGGAPSEYTASLLPHQPQGKGLWGGGEGGPFKEERRGFSTVRVGAGGWGILTSVQHIHQIPGGLAVGRQLTHGKVSPADNRFCFAFARGRSNQLSFAHLLLGPCSATRQPYSCAHQIF